MPKTVAPDQEWRQVRLADLAKLPEFGGKAGLGRALGFRDGAFVGQMINGSRPITEKTVTAVHQLHGGKFRGWFDRPLNAIVADDQLSIGATAEAVDETLLHIEGRLRAVLKDRKLLQLLTDLEDIPDALRSKLLDTIHQHAESAREVVEHHERRRKTMAAHAPRRRAQRSITIRLGDGNPDQGSLELRIADDPFTAQPDERELELYHRIAKDRTHRR